MSSRTRGTSRAQSLTVFVALAVAFYASWLVMRPFLGVLTWAVVMTVLFYPVHRRLEARLGPGVIAALVSTLLVIVVILLPAAFIITAVVSEIREMATGLPQTLDEWLNPANPVSGRAVQLVERVVSLDGLRDPDLVRNSVEGWGAGIASGSLRLVGGALSGVVQTALVIFTMFFLFKDARVVTNSLMELVPVENQRLRALFARMREVIRASVYGTLLLAVIQGGLGGLAFAVLGLPAPFLWGLVMTIASIVPVLGAFVVWIPAAIYLLAIGSTGKAIALAAWGMVVIGMADNVLRPILVGSRTRMHELLIFFGVLGGIQTFGALGVIVGPVIFAVTLALVQALREVGAPRAVGGAAA